MSDLEEEDDDNLQEMMYDLSAYINPEEDQDENEGNTGEWRTVDNPPVVLSIDGVQQRLFDCAREEVPAVLANLMTFLSKQK